MKITSENVKVDTLGLRRVKSPLPLSSDPGDNMGTHLPIPLAVAEKKRVSPKSELWRGVLSATGQAKEFVSE